VEQGEYWLAAMLTPAWSYADGLGLPRPIRYESQCRELAAACRADADAAHAVGVPAVEALAERWRAELPAATAEAPAPTCAGVFGMERTTAIGAPARGSGGTGCGAPWATGGRRGTAPPPPT
jgi:hypothetical protein